MDLRRESIVDNGFRKPGIFGEELTKQSIVENRSRKQSVIAIRKKKISVAEEMGLQSIIVNKA